MVNTYRRNFNPVAKGPLREKSKSNLTSVPT